MGAAETSRAWVGAAQQRCGTAHHRRLSAVPRGIASRSSGAHCKHHLVVYHGRGAGQTKALQSDPIMAPSKLPCRGTAPRTEPPYPPKPPAALPFFSPATMLAAQSLARPAAPSRCAHWAHARGLQQAGARRAAAAIARPQRRAYALPVEGQLRAVCAWMERLVAGLPPLQQ